jgi:hypothetical protein
MGCDCHHDLDKCIPVVGNEKFLPTWMGWCNITLHHLCIWLFLDLLISLCNLLDIIAFESLIQVNKI